MTDNPSEQPHLIGERTVQYEIKAPQPLPAWLADWYRYTPAPRTLSWIGPVTP